MELKNSHLLGLGLGLVVILASLIFLRDSRFYLLILGVGVLGAVVPFVLTTIQETRVATEKEEMFLEFARNLVESVKTGTPISKSIINMKEKSFGVLGPHVDKLANQIYLGIPLNRALRIFAKDVQNKSISRSLTLIGQAERAGGDIGQILESVAEAVNTSDKIKKERRAAISTLVTQGYIIFFVFMIIVLIMQFQILPMVSGIANVGDLGVGSAGEIIDPEEIANAFLYLLLIQGFFTGLTIGRLSEGNVKAGIKHSFALIFLAFIVSAGANTFFG